MGALSINELVELDMRLRLAGVVLLVLRKLLCRRNCAAAAMAALEGVTPLAEARELDRGKSMPSRFSTGGSSLAALVRLSSRFANVNDALRLGGSLFVSDSSSLVSLSKRPGYRSLIDLVGLSSACPPTVSVLAIPLASTIRMIDARFGLCSEIGPRGVLPTRFSGEAVRGACVKLLLRLSGSAVLVED